MFFMTPRSFFLGVLSENIVQCHKTFFFYVCYMSILFPLQVLFFLFFSELIDLGSKLSLQGDQFRSRPTELGS